MGDTAEVDDAALRQLARAHDTAATTLTATPAPPSVGSPVWATTSAVSNGYSLVTAVTTTLANRSSTTGTKIHTASGSYTSTDEGSAERIAGIGQTVQV